MGEAVAMLDWIKNRVVDKANLKAWILKKEKIISNRNFT